MTKVIDTSVALSIPTRSERSTFVTILVAVGATAIVGYFLPTLVSGYWLKTLTSSVAVALAALSVSLLYAQLGMVSLCQYALLGVGGWVALRIAHGTDLPFEVALLSGGVVAAGFGLIVGLPALRMRGLYLAIITLMMAGGLQVLFSAWGFPDGGPGFIGRVLEGSRSMMRRPPLALSDIAYFRYAVTAVAICFLVVYWQYRSRAGRAWAMIRRGDACALAAGVNIVAYKVWAFTLAGFLAGIAGGLLAGSVGQLDGSAFHARESIMLFALTVISGAFDWIGPILAGLLSRGVPAALNEWGVNGNIATIIFGVGLLHALITAPEGASGQIIQLVKWLRTRAARRLANRST